MTFDQPERRSLAQQSQDDWEALRSVGELFPGTPLGDSADELPAWPENLSGTPVVLAAGAADIVLRVAAATARELTLVVTDDVDAARAVLDAQGRNEVQVSDSGNAAAEIATEGPIRWIGGSTNANALTALLGSEVVGRLRVTQLQVAGGAGPLLEAAQTGQLKLDLVSPNPGDGELGPTVAVAAALLLPFVDLRQVPVGVDADGRFAPQAGGTVLWWGVSPEAGAIQAWLDRVQGGN
ncbi:hypothetical protein [Kribbella shirazensis]|uniref:Uncharacterized protein n=1 Tax=Kribbella shirazensis TaxID=1105143 RepID=A0A7X5V823_9ACTN|nr:hypothetical protein [Kribbella shirazensis]NIK55583.1 hypothetical protein [Kribbella shirazensis]